MQTNAFVFSAFTSKIFAAFGEIGEQAGEEFVRQVTINHFPTESSLIVVFLEDGEHLLKRNRDEESGQMGVLVVLVVVDMCAGHVVGDGVDEAQKVLFVADMGMASVQTDAQTVVVEFANQRQKFFSGSAIAVAACVLWAGIFVEKIFESGIDA